MYRGRWLSSFWSISLQFTSQSAEYSKLPGDYVQHRQILFPHHLQRFILVTLTHRTHRTKFVVRYAQKYCELNLERQPWVTIEPTQRFQQAIFLFKYFIVSTIMIDKPRSLANHFPSNKETIYISLHLFSLFLAEHVTEIVETLFQYLSLLRREGPQENLFQECAVSEGGRGGDGEGGRCGCEGGRV